MRCVTLPLSIRSHVCVYLIIYLVSYIDCSLCAEPSQCAVCMYVGCYVVLWSVVVVWCVAVCMQWLVEFGQI